MITNERQYRITKAALREFEAALDHNIREGERGNPVVKSDIEALGSEVDSLTRQLRQFEELRDGSITDLTVDFHNLGEALILARVAANLKQKELAEKVGLKPQQIQRYEASQYEHASLARLEEIVWALGCQVRVQMHLPSTKQPKKSARRHPTTFDLGVAHDLQPSVVAGLPEQQSGDATSLCLANDMTITFDSELGATA